MHKLSELALDVPVVVQMQAWRRVLTLAGACSIISMTLWGTVNALPRAFSRGQYQTALGKICIVGAIVSVIFVALVGAWASFERLLVSRVELVRSRLLIRASRWNGGSVEVGTFEWRGRTLVVFNAAGRRFVVRPSERGYGVILSAIAAMENGT